MASNRMLALLGLLAVAGYQNRDKLGELLGGVTGAGNTGNKSPQGTGNVGAPQASGGGLLDGVLGGLFGGAAGGNQGSSQEDISGGLGDLVDQFKERGHGETAKSWVERGPNREVEPDALQTALGDDTLDALTRQTGLSREELLSRLRSVLPTAVDNLTPEGHVPSQADIARWAGR